MVRRLLCQFRMREETKDAKTVVDRDGDDALARHALAVVAPLGSVPGNESASVEVDEDRKPLSAGLRGRPDVQVKTVLAHAIRAKVHVSEDGRLHCPRPELIGFAHAIPALYRQR